MIDVFLVGHGFMHQERSVSLSVPILFYTIPGMMLDGPRIRDVVDGGPQAFREDQADGQVAGARPHFMATEEHYLCSGYDSYADVNRTAAWANKLSRETIDIGEIVSAPHGNCVFFTRRNVAVSLSRIVRDLDSMMSCLAPAAFGPNPLIQMHWMACRSYVSGSGRDEILASINGGHLVHADELIED